MLSCSCNAGSSSPLHALPNQSDGPVACRSVPLPGYPTGDIGLIMTLSQKPCANGGCCVGSSCANWAGAHISSLGCIQYGAPPLAG